jgi:uncharacterized oligopeptide transporter (OPT) family protein
MSKVERTKISSVVALISAGTIAWVAAAVVALAAGSEAKIIWTCLVGAALGIIGIRYSIRRNKRSAI